MMRRYFQTADQGVPPAPTGTRIGSVTILSESSNTITEKTKIIGGPAGGTVTVKITTLSGTGTGGQYFAFNGTIQFLNNTITLTLDASGEVEYTTITYAGSVKPGAIQAVVTIFSVSAGTIGTPSSRTYSHTA